MSIMDMFRSKAADPVPQPGSGGTNSSDPSLNNPTVPGGGTPKSDGSVTAIPKAGEGEQSPLAAFENLWQPNDPKDAKKPTSLVPEIKIDPNAILNAAKTVDFTKAIPQELKDRMAKGDQTAFLEAVNLVGQISYAQSSGAAATMIKKVLEQQANVFKTQVMPEILREHTISQTVRADNKLFENPAVTPMLSMIESQLMQKYPAASASEISQKAKEYFSGFATEFLAASGKVVSDKPATSGNSKGKSDATDWEKWFGAGEAAA